MTQEEWKKFGDKLTAAVQRAVKEAIEDHHRNGQYAVIMKSGKMIRLHPSGEEEEIVPKEKM
jgi:hypothetical protein